MASARPVSAGLEPRAAGGASSSPSVVRLVNHKADTPAVSQGDFPADLHGLRRRLPDEWAAFLRAHFKADVQLIEVFFGVDRKTAKDWLAGKHGVNGAPLLLLIRNNPAARRHFLGEAA